MKELRQLTETDALFIAGETETVYQHTAGFVVLDTSGCPGFDFPYFREKVIERIRMVPHFHWKLHEVPLGLDLPYWVEDDRFSYDHHLKRIAVPSPGDREALAEVVAHLYAKHLDRRRPLWEIWLIEGLEGGKFAILQKLHHCLMDGQGAMKLGELLCDFSPDAEPRPVDAEIADARPGAVPAPGRLAARTASHLARFPGAVTRKLYGFAQPKVVQRLRPQPERRGPGKPPIPIAPFNGAVGSDRGFVFGSVSLDDVKAVKNAFSVSVNDVVLGLVASSVREYLLEDGDLPEATLRAMVAISLRGEGDDELSNKVTNTTIGLATDLEDPVERLRAISAEAEGAKHRARGGGVGVMEIVQTFPPVLVSAMLGVSTPEQSVQMLGSNLIVSNVRGGSDPMYVAGARMENMYPMSIITPGIGINFTCVSYVDGVHFGVAVAPDLCPRPWRLVDGLTTALEGYLALAGKKAAPKAKKTGRKATSAARSGKRKAAGRRKSAAKRKATRKPKT